MAKAKKINVKLLNSIATAPDGIGRVSKDDATPLIAENLIEVNTADVDDSDKAAARLTDAGKAYLSNATNQTETNTNKDKPMYGIMKGFTPPPSQRGNRKGAGAPTVYPFATMEVGDSFFVSNADKPDAAKKLGSTVSQFNMKYRTEIPGETETKTVTKRGKGNKAELDASGNKVTEEKTVPKYTQDRKFILRAVKKGVAYGDWTAPEDGAVVAREK